MGNIAKETESMEQAGHPSIQIRCTVRQGSNRGSSRTGIPACLFPLIPNRQTGMSVLPHLSVSFAFSICVSPPRRAGPRSILCSCNQASRYRIVFDVPDDSLLFTRVPHPMVKRFVLPERLYGPAQN